MAKTVALEVDRSDLEECVGFQKSEIYVGSRPGLV